MSVLQRSQIISKNQQRRQVARSPKGCNHLLDGCLSSRCLNPTLLQWTYEFRQAVTGLVVIGHGSSLEAQRLVLSSVCRQRKVGTLVSSPIREGEILRGRVVIDRMSKVRSKCDPVNS